MLNKVMYFPLVLVLGIVLSRCNNDKKKAEEPVAPATSAAPAPEPAPQGGADLKAETIYFAYDDYSLNTDARDRLTNLANALKANTSAVAQVEGHCDERGSIEYNLALGERRATSVKNFLVQLGVDAARLSTISYGEERPSAQGHDESAWSKNRRAEFVISRN